LVAVLDCRYLIHYLINPARSHVKEKENLFDVTNIILTKLKKQILYITTVVCTGVNITKM